MDIQAAGTNSYHIYQSALEQGSDLISSFPGRIPTQNSQANQTKPGSTARTN